jgi:hypothetical protein
MQKTQGWGTKNEGPQLVLAAESAEGRKIFGGKTLAQIGAEYDLADEDVEWYNPKLNDGRVIRNVLITVNGKMYQIPISRGLTKEMCEEPEIVLNCLFRNTFKQVVEKGEDGVMTPKFEKDGKTPVLANGENGLKMEHYMSFGKPNGLVLQDDAREQMFETIAPGPDDLKADSERAKATA